MKNKTKARYIRAFFLFYDIMNGNIINLIETIIIGNGIYGAVVKK